MHWSLKLIFISVFLIIGCETTYSKDISLIPMPLTLHKKSGSFFITPSTKIVVESNNPEMFEIGEYVADMLKSATGYALEIIKTNDVQKSTGVIVLTVKDFIKPIWLFILHIGQSVPKITLSSPSLIVFFRIFLYIFTSFFIS